MFLQKYNNISFKKRTNCAVCTKELDKPLINLPKFPLTEIYTKEKPAKNEKGGFLDQYFHICSQCGHGQISNIISPDFLYGNSYHFRTSESKSGSKVNDVFLKFISSVTQDKHFKTVIEIGCSDLYLLNSLKQKGDKIIGIDPILNGQERDEKIIVIGDMIENIDLNQFDLDDCLIICSHTIEHLDNPREILKNILQHATPNTRFLFQFPGFDTLLDNCRFDQIFHQHLNYFSLHSFRYLLKELGAMEINHEINFQHWGSLQIAFKKNDIDIMSNGGDIKSEKVDTRIDREKVLSKYALFKERMKNLNLYLQSIDKEKIIGYGAALMLPVLSYHLRNDLSNLDYIIDDDNNKEGLFYINLPIIIKNSNSIDNVENKTLFITAIDNTRQILLKAISLQPKRIITVLNNI